MQVRGFKFLFCKISSVLPLLINFSCRAMARLSKEDFQDIALNNLQISLLQDETQHEYYFDLYCLPDSLITLFLLKRKIINI